MKKNYILLTFLLSFIYVSHGQISGTIHYKVKLTSVYFDKKATKKNNKLELVNKVLIENIDKFNFTLKFNKKESLFTVENLMTQEDISRKYKLAKILIEGKNSYYFNDELNLKLTQLSAFGQDFIIKDSISNIKWNLTKESKNIDNYICYKATTKRIIVNSKGTFYKNVTAWYTPQLPLVFGPKGYGGLPGLILELKEDRFIYYASKIEFIESEAVKIEKPKKGKLVTKDEFDEIVNNTEVSFGEN